MAINDTVLIDGILDQRVADGMPSADRSEVFEYFGFEQRLKNYDLSSEEIEGCWIDGRADGGIDGIFLFINGRLLLDPGNFAWPRSNAMIELWIITCKHHETFKQAPVESLVATVHELLDLSLDRRQLKGAYSSELLHVRSMFGHAYQRLASARPSISINFSYISRGDSGTVGNEVKQRAEQVIAATNDLFSSATSTFEFLGAAELVEMYRKEKTFSLTLPISEHLASAQSGYVVLAHIDDYADFVSDDSGHLRRYLFDSNVRDFLGPSQVNEDILQSLVDVSAPEFWWLNNGVTILTTNATMIGKTAQLDNIQIVNGLQTTETIFKYRNSKDHITSNRCILIKSVYQNEACKNR